MKLLQYCLVAFLVVQAAHAQDDAPLRYQFTEGQTLRYRVTQTANVSADAAEGGSFAMQTEQVTELAWRVASVDEQGIAKIEQTVPKLKFKTTSPQGKVGFDSESEDPPMGVAAMLAPSVRTLLETPVTFTVSPIGKVGKITAPRELIASLDRVPGASQVLEGEPALRSMIEAALPLLPPDDKPLTRKASINSAASGDLGLVSEFQPGETEEPGITRITFQFKADKPSSVNVTKSEGVALVATPTGRLVSSTVTLVIQPSVDKVTAMLDQKTTVKLLEQKSAAPE